MGIQAIIWDSGGVLVRTEDWTPRDNLADRLGLTRKELKDLVFGTRADARLQLGEISSEEHWNNISQTLGLSAAQTVSLRSEFFAGDELDSGLIDYIRELKQKYRIAMLSNAPSDARNAISEMWHIDDAFDLIIISAEVGFMKPDLAIYELTLEQLGFEPHETVFIDDFSENIKAAHQLGMHTILFQDSEQTRADLQSLLEDAALDLL